MDRLVERMIRKYGTPVLLLHNQRSFPIRVLLQPADEGQDSPSLLGRVYSYTLLCTPDVNLQTQDRFRWGEETLQITGVEPLQGLEGPLCTRVFCRKEEKL